MFALMALMAAPAAAQMSQGIVAAPAASEAPTATSCALESFVMPTTGVAFSLPPAAGEPAGECVDPGPPPPVRPPAPSLFRMAALPIGNSVAAAKWQTARQGSLSGLSGPWDELLEQANRVTSGNPIGMVNQWVNWHVRYRPDVGADEWSPAASTLSRGAGDCEDFALAKMALLLALGVPSDDMYMVLLRDRRQVEHAVLAVKREGRLYVLDNRTDKVLPAEAVDDYTPIVSFSGPFAWTYGRRAG